MFSTEHVKELCEEFYELQRQAALNNKLSADMSNFFDFIVPDGMKTVIAVASPVPIVEVVFHVGQNKIETQVPPTYAEYGKLQYKIAEQISVINQLGSRVCWANRLPEKMCAAHSGLAAYGRNNLCYVEDIGSFALLSAYYTDASCEYDYWQPCRRMALCDYCKKCVKACPTGAIRADRRIIDAGLCITRHNESAEKTFPEFILPQHHNSIVGCLHCQIACPLNSEHRSRTVKGVEFNEAETELLISNGEYENLPDVLKNKINAIGITKYYKMIPKNLKALS